MNSNRDGDKIYTVVPMNVVKKEGNLYTFSVTTKIDLAGSFKVAYRMFPKIPICRIDKISVMCVGLNNQIVVSIIE